MPKLGVDAPDLLAAFEDIRRSGFFTEGKYTKLFEAEVSRWSGMHAVSVSNCGTGLFAVLRSIPKRSGVAVVPVNTFFATGAMAQEAGFMVVGADVSRKDFSLSVEDLERYAPTGADVVILTHVGGGLAHDYAGIASWCERHKALLIEDAAHALGCKTQHGVTAGRLGAAAVYSLYATKSVPVGEGGVVVTRDANLAEEVRRFCNYGKYQAAGLRYSGVGFNFRMSEWTSAIGMLQMRRLNEILDLRNAAADKLRAVCPPLVESENSNWYKYIVPASFPAKKVAGRVYASSDQLTATMDVAGVFPNAEWIGSGHKCLPIDEGQYAGMTTGEIEEYLGV
jgi:perosamine synthetase